MTKNHRTDVLAKVTGRAKYAADMKLAGMVHAVVVRSPIASGRVLSVDCAAALAVPGVLAVYTARDIPGSPGPPKERPVLCGGRVRCIGDGVALVVGESRRTASQAAALVAVACGEMPAVLDARKALDENAPPVHGGGNQICRYVTKRGSAEAALAAAPHVLRRQYHTPRVQHVCMETEAAVAVYDPDSREMTVHCPANSPFVIRRQVAEALAFPLAGVRVVLPAIGGSFGGKNYDIAMAACRAAMASFHLKRPCKLWLSREESIEEGTKRHPLWADYSVGFDNDGRLLAAKIDLLLDGGAYTGKTHPVTSRMAIEATGPYYVPAVDTTATSVYTNNVYADALRGFGSPQVDFCSESLMDEIAGYLGKDPLEIRRLNAVREGGPSSVGQTMRGVTLAACAQKLEEEAGLFARRKACENFNKTSRDVKKGVGVAFLHRGESFGAAGQGIDVAEGAVSIQPDGSVQVFTSIAEVGQGARGMMVTMVHNALGLPRESIRLAPVDTGVVPDGGPTVATRGTVFTGGAVLDAVKQVKAKLAQYAEQRLHTSAVVFADGFIIDEADSANRAAFAEVVKEVFAAGGHLNACGHFTAPPLAYDKSCGVGEAYASYVYGAAAAQVTVDLCTGAVQADEFFAVHDVGHAFDMEEVKGQIMGGVSMGVGYALYEEVPLNGGRVQCRNLDSYLIPTALDMPRMTPVALELPGGMGPMGAKGLGEPATCAVAPAIINAIHHACGRRVRQLPASLEQVLLGQALRRHHVG